MNKYYDKVSLWSKIINFSFKFTNAKKNSETVEGAKQFIEQLKESQTEYKLPEKLKFKKEMLNEIEVYYYNGNLKDNNKKLLYIHGGSYIEEAT